MLCRILTRKYFVLSSLKSRARSEHSWAVWGGGEKPGPGITAHFKDFPLSNCLFVTGIKTTKPVLCICSLSFSLPWCVSVICECAVREMCVWAPSRGYFSVYQPKIGAHVQQLVVLFRANVDEQIFELFHVLACRFFVVVLFPEVVSCFTQTCLAARNLPTPDRSGNTNC